MLIVHVDTTGHGKIKLEAQKRDSKTVNASKWERALMYKEARTFFKTDKAFGGWLSELWFTGAGKPDSRQIVW